MTDVEVAYAAGFFDGEGHVGVSSYNGQVQVSVSNTDRAMLAWFQKNWGGGIYEGKRAKAHHKPHYEWKIGARAAGRFLRDIVPYLTLSTQGQYWPLLWLIVPACAGWGTIQAGREPQRT